MARHERARDLIQRHVDEMLSEEESVELGRSIAEDPAVAALFASMTRLDYAIETSVAGQKDAARTIPARSTETGTRRFLRRWRWAAAVLLALTPSIMMYILMIPSARGMAVGFNLTAAVTPTGTVRLVWEDHLNDEEGFQIEKSANGIDFQEIARVGPDTMTYEDTGLRTGNILYYRIRGFNAKGWSDFSDVVGVATTPQSLINISARGYVAQDPHVLIAGIIITGNKSKKVLIRTLGPTLAGAGVSNPLRDPMLLVHTDGKLIARNNDWLMDDREEIPTGYLRGGPEEIKATGMGPGRAPLRTDSHRESAILITLPPGAYTASVIGVGETSGTAIVEVVEVK